MAIKLNKAAYEKAESMIKKGFEVETKSNNWEKVKPTETEILNYLDSHNLEEYGLWFLGINTDAPQNKNIKYVYPYGDFKVVQESALIAAEELAKKNNDIEIKEAANNLLKKIVHNKKIE